MVAFTTTCRQLNNVLDTAYSNVHGMSVAACYSRLHRIPPPRLEFISSLLVQHTQRWHAQLHLHTHASAVLVLRICQCRNIHLTMFPMFPLLHDQLLLPVSRQHVHVTHLWP
jgi:hypothetical protein